jgi:hypothetical protein
MSTPENQVTQDADADRGATGQELGPTHFEREDDRWRWQNQLRDWIILGVMILIYLAWTGVVYFFEPGIR